ncbi:hypothetical protein F4782DRAFT_500744 [Xylaria castorea]|nr:hypothetical protein F4782DRAFT_500744 [Xylaria castorea]
MTSRRSPPASTHRANPASKPPRISLISWLAVGGTGTPPTPASFCLMASERKAAYRREQAYKEARKAARADFEEKWPTTGLTGGGATKRQKPPGRRELMGLYGPKGTARRRMGEDEGGNRHDREGTGRNDDDDDDGTRNEESNYGNDNNDAEER